MSASVSIDWLLVLVELSHLFSTALKLAAILDIKFDTTFTDAVGLDLFGKNCPICSRFLLLHAEMLDYNCLGKIVFFAEIINVTDSCQQLRRQMFGPGVKHNLCHRLYQIFKKFKPTQMKQTLLKQKV